MTTTQHERESEQINGARHTHNYMAAYNAGEHNSDASEYYTARFEHDTGVSLRSVSEDVGGLVLYREQGRLIAFYDYELFCGAVFA